MASPLSNAKRSVDLSRPAVRVSRIRRDPPPPEKKVTAAEVKQIEARNLVIGVSLFALALVAILAGVNASGGWSPSEYRIEIRSDE